MQAVLLQSQYTLRVVVTELAEGTDAEHLGELIGLFGIPIAGLILLIVGLRRRSSARRLPPAYPPPGPYPYGPPPAPPSPPMPPQYYPTRLSSASSETVGCGVDRRRIADAGLRPARNPRPRNRFGVTSSRPGAFGACRAVRLTIRFPGQQHVADTAGLRSIRFAARGRHGRGRGPRRAPTANSRTRSTRCCSIKRPPCASCSTSRRVSVTRAPARRRTRRLLRRPATLRCPSYRSSGAIDGDSDHALCPAETKAVSYPKPARLYCLQPVRN